jgi:hypothetical protein
MAATERWENDTSRCDVTVTRWPLGETQSTWRVSVPARMSSVRWCSSTCP